MGKDYQRSAPKAIALSETTQNSGHYAVQGHSRSPLSIPVESRICNFLLVYDASYILSRAVSEMWRYTAQIFADDRAG